MGFTICSQCGEKIRSLTQTCPKCGLFLEKKLSPVFMGILITGILFVLVVIGLMLF